MKDWDSHYFRRARQVFRRNAVGCWGRYGVVSVHNVQVVWSIAWQLTLDTIGREECWLWRPRKMLARERWCRLIRQHEKRREAKFVQWAIKTGDDGWPGYECPRMRYRNKSHY